MLEHAKRNGLDPVTVDSVYLKGEEAIREHEKRNGYDLEFGPNGVMSSQQENTNDVSGSDVNAIKVKEAFKLGDWSTS